MSSVVLQPSGKYRAFAQVKHMREAKVFAREDKAKTWADGVEKQMRAGTWTALQKEDRGVTVTQAFERYKESEDWLSKEADTTRKVELSKQKPVIATLGNTALKDLTTDTIEEYIAARRKARPQRSKDPEAKMSGTSIRLEVASLSSMLNWAVKKKLVATNVAKHVKKPEDRRRTERLDDAILGAILEKDAILCDPVAYVFFRILFTTACRPGELAKAKKSWLRNDPPQIALPTTKNDDPRTIVLPVNLYDSVKAHMQEQPADCPYIFGTKKRYGDGWSPYNYRVAWDAALAAARAKGEVPKDVQLVTYHARHETISRLFERTKMSDGQIAAVSGHRSSQALWRYKHLRNEHNRGVINALDDMVTDIINRAISPSHPSESLKIGELLTDKPARKQVSAKEREAIPESERTTARKKPAKK
jgi:integrase